MINQVGIDISHNLKSFLIYINIILLIFSSVCFANDELERLNMNPEAYTSQGKYKVYTHYVFYLTPTNTILPGDPRSPYQDQTSNYRDDILDEHSENFKYGQFEVFIPVKNFPFKKHCNNTIVLRMGQTHLDKNWMKDDHPLIDHPDLETIEREYIKESQDLYFKIKDMVVNNKGNVRVIIELHSFGCTAFFRSAYGKYIDYTGQYIREY